jgi:hypothetical protein
MEDRTFDKHRRAAKRERDRKIRQALRSTGKRPPKSERRLHINAEWHEDYEDRKAG